MNVLEIRILRPVHHVRKWT